MSNDNPMVTLNRAVALAMGQGPAAGLERLAALDEDPRLADHHRLHAVRGHLFERLGDASAPSITFAKPQTARRAPRSGTIS